MCLIIHKKAGVALDKAKLTVALNMSFNRNQDGLGFMIKNPETISCYKGFKTVEAMTKVLFSYTMTELRKKEIAIHLRNASPNTGKTTDTMQPIIVNDKENAMEHCQTTNVGIVHNGVFRDHSIPTMATAEERAVLSDTILFGKEYFGGDKCQAGMVMFNYIEKNHPKLLREACGFSNKLVIFKAGLKTFKHGTFIESEGLSYSNDSYKTKYAKGGGSPFRRPAPVHQNTAPFPTTTRTSSKEDIIATYNTASLFKEVGTFLHSSLPFSCIDVYKGNKTKSCILKGQACCMNQKTDDPHLGAKQAIHDLFESGDFNKVVQFGHHERKALEYVTSRPDEYLFYWHQCDSCEGTNESVYTGGRCIQCDMGGLQLGICKKIVSQSNVTYHKVTTFEVKSHTMATSYGSYAPVSTIIRSLRVYAQKITREEGAKLLDKHLK